MAEQGDIAADAAGQPIVGRSRHGALTLDQLAALQPGLGRLMPEISDRYWILYYAAQAGHWRLAGYQLRQVRNLMMIGATTRPAQAQRLSDFTAHYLGPIEKAIMAEDFAAFDQAFRASVTAVNAYHVETGHPEIVWQLPDEPPKHLALRADGGQARHEP